MSGIVGSNLGRGSGVVGAAAVGAVSGTNLTALNATNLGSGTASVARGGTGAATHTLNNVLVGAGTSALTSVAPSTSGNVLTSNGSTWASTAAAGGGKVLQCIMDTEIVILSTTTTSWVDLMTVTITPATSSSRFLLMASTNSHSSDSGSRFGFFRDTTEIFFGTDQDEGTYGAWAGGNSYDIGVGASHYLDSPSTTSEIVYRFKWTNPAGGGTIHLNRNSRDSGSDPRFASSFIVMEIGA